MMADVSGPGALASEHSPGASKKFEQLQKWPASAVLGSVRCDTEASQQRVLQVHTGAPDKLVVYKTHLSRWES